MNDRGEYPCWKKLLYGVKSIIHWSIKKRIKVLLKVSFVVFSQNVLMTGLKMYSIIYAHTNQ